MEKSHTVAAPAPAPSVSASANKEATSIHAGGDISGEAEQLEEELKAAVLKKYGSAQQAFGAVAKDGVCGKKEWKKLAKKLMSEDNAKKLKKRLPKKGMQEEAFVRFISGSVPSSQGVGRPNRAPGSTSYLAVLPVEVTCRFSFWRCTVWRMLLNLLPILLFH